MNHTYRFSLDKTSKKHICPNCSRKRLVRYVHNEESAYLPEYVGRCDREQSCGYHYPPKQFFKNNPDYKKGKHEDWKQSDLWRVKLQEKFQPKQLDFIPATFLKRSLQANVENYFLQYLVNLFGDEISKKLKKQFYIGTSKRWYGATVFWQIDITGNIRQAKVMLYNPLTGKRVKQAEKPQQGRAKIYFAGKSLLKQKGIQNPCLQQCMFGEHQLKNAPKDKPVAIVESEKTAILMSCIYPKYTWLATGGKNGCRWTDSSVNQVLRGRKVMLYPDLGCYEDWSEKSEILRNNSVQIIVSDILERYATKEEREQGLDLADYFIKRDEKLGLALSDEGYPLMWDL